MSWAERKVRMDQRKSDALDAAKHVCAVLREQARGGLGYYVDADDLADRLEEELLPREAWEEPNREPTVSAPTIWR